MKKTLKAVACVALLALAGCGSWSPNNSAEDELCNELAQLDRSVTELASLDPATATGAQVQALRNDIQQEYEEVQEAAKDVKSQRIDNVNSAYQSVQKAIITAQTQGVAAADAEIDQAAAQLNQARTQFNMAAGC